MSATETTIKAEHKLESRTEMMLSGELINYVLIGPTGVRIYRKGGGMIDVTNSDVKRSLQIQHNNKEQ